MKLTNIVKSILNEKHGDTYDYGCVMLYFNFPEVNKIHDAINPEHIYTSETDRSYGLEDEPHTTLLYGLHSEVTVADVKAILNKFTFGPCQIHNPSLFKNPEYDVLKFDVKGSNLHKANDALRKFPHTNSYPDYHPHLTIGYIKSGMGSKYETMLRKNGQEYTLVPTNAVYSHPDGTKTNIKIKVGI
jgi:hypothetical protein